MNDPSTLRSLVDRLDPITVVGRRGDPDVVVTGVTHDSREVVAGTLYVCMPGTTADGHDFAVAAVRAGASALLVSRLVDVEVPQIVVDDTRAALGPVASAFHGDPSRSLTVVGVTGTNGKTTTAHLLAAILDHAGRRTRVFGTLTGARTTPEASEVQRRLAEAVDEGVDTVVMEVSSHALQLQRVSGTRFAVAVFTNLGRDHLDLHGSAEAYFRAKARLFAPALSDRAVVNVDDLHGRLLADSAEIPTTTFSTADAADVEVTVDQHRFTWRGHRVEVPLGGATNLSNSLAALTVAAELGIEPGVAAAGIATVEQVPGRFEVVPAPPGTAFTAVVDYAHTPEGLVELLRSARSVAGHGRVLLVFGCGGDRDRDKRPLMGAAAVDGADVVIVTSDNPRGEAPSEIAADIVSGMTSGRGDQVVVELDRAAAIDRAVDSARPGDLVIVAGKGHETTQTIGGVDHPFDDRVEVRRSVERRTGVEGDRT